MIHCIAINMQLKADGNLQRRGSDFLLSGALSCFSTLHAPVRPCVCVWCFASLILNTRYLSFPFMHFPSDATPHKRTYSSGSSRQVINLLSYRSKTAAAASFASLAVHIIIISINPESQGDELAGYLLDLPCIFCVGVWRMSFVWLASWERNA